MWEQSGWQLIGPQRPNASAVTRITLPPLEPGGNVELVCFTHQENCRSILPDHSNAMKMDSGEPIMVVV